MTARRYASRRSVLKLLGVTGGLALGTGTVAAEGHTFFARLSDNPSIPGHEKVFSRGRGRLDLHWATANSSPALDFELSVANLEAGAFAAHIHGQGRADGDIWVTLHKTRRINNETVYGTITDDDVKNELGGVEDLIHELVEGNGVVNVRTDIEPDGEIAGIVRPRPVAGWIAV